MQSHEQGTRDKRKLSDGDAVVESHSALVGTGMASFQSQFFAQAMAAGNPATSPDAASSSNAGCLISGERTLHENAVAESLTDTFAYKMPWSESSGH